MSAVHFPHFRTLSCPGWTRKPPVPSDAVSFELTASEKEPSASLQAFAALADGTPTDSGKDFHDRPGLQARGNSRGAGLRLSPVRSKRSFLCAGR